jgi:hypothetical protein
MLRWNSPSRPEGTDAAPRRSPVRGLRDAPERGARSLDAPRGVPRRPSRSSSRSGSRASSRRRRVPPPGARSDCGRGREAPGMPSTGRRSPAAGLPAPEPDGLPDPEPAPRGKFRRVGARYAEPSRATRSGRSSENSCRLRPGTASVSLVVGRRPWADEVAPKGALRPAEAPREVLLGRPRGSSRDAAGRGLRSSPLGEEPRFSPRNALLGRSRRSARSSRGARSGKERLCAAPLAPGALRVAPGRSRSVPEPVEPPRRSVDAPWPRRVVASRAVLERGRPRPGSDPVELRRGPLPKSRRGPSPADAPLLGKDGRAGFRRGAPAPDVPLEGA